MTPELARAIETVLAHPKIQGVQASIALGIPGGLLAEEDLTLLYAMDTLRSAIEPPADPAPLPRPGVSLFDIAADIARTQSRMLTHEQRAEGRVISPRPQRPNIHD